MPFSEEGAKLINMSWQNDDVDKMPHMNLVVSPKAARQRYEVPDTMMHTVDLVLSVCY